MSATRRMLKITIDSQYPAKTALSGMLRMMRMTQAITWRKQARKPQGMCRPDASISTAVSNVMKMPIAVTPSG